MRKAEQYIGGHTVIHAPGNHSQRLWYATARAKVAKRKGQKQFDVERAQERTQREALAQLNERKGPMPRVQFHELARALPKVSGRSTKRERGRAIVGGPQP